MEESERALLQIRDLNAVSEEIKRKTFLLFAARSRMPQAELGLAVSKLEMQSAQIREISYALTLKTEHLKNLLMPNTTHKQ